MSNRCLFYNLDFLKWVLPMKLQHLEMIKKHVTQASSCRHHPTLKDVIFCDGPSPLILACQVGELDTVKHIIEIWGVDVNASATYFSDPSSLNSSKIKIRKASPLFVAAFHGHSRIVRYLLERGADAFVQLPHLGHNGEYDGWTPLYAALFDVQLDSRRPLLEQQEERNVIVRTLLEFMADQNADSSRGKPIWTESMCGPELIAKLINHGLDLNQRTPDTGQTLLHHVIGRFPEEVSLDLVILLVNNGADLRARDNKDGFTPLLTAANSFNLKILDYLLERNSYSRTEKIEAMELAGSTILLEALDASRFFPKAFDYWRRAHQLRQLEKEASGPSAEKKMGRNIGSNQEWTTLAQLDQLEQQPEEYVIQAVLVKLRILSGFGGNGHRSLSSWFIDYISANSYSLNQVWWIQKFSQIVDIRLGTFDVTISRLNPLSTDRNLLIQIIKDIDNLVESLSKFQGLYPTPGLTLSNYYNMLKVSMDVILLATRPTTPLTETKPGKLSISKQAYYIMFSQSIYPLLEMIFRLPEFPDEHSTSVSLAQMLRQLEPYLGAYRLEKLLLLAFPSFEYMQRFPNRLKFVNSSALIRVLLEAGANPNAVADREMLQDNNTLLHLVASVSDRELGDAAGLLLVEFGANPHLVNICGKSPLDIWIERNEREDNWNKDTGGWSARPEWTRPPVPTLLRQAARVIRDHKIPYTDGGIIPATLYGVIESHKIYK